MNLTKKFMAVVLLGAVCFAATAADVARLGPTLNAPYAVIDSKNSSVALEVYATNGVYPKSITATGSVTNHVVVPVIGNSVELTFSAASRGGASTGVLTIKAAGIPPALGYVSAAGKYGTGGYTNASPMSTFATLTIVTKDDASDNANVAACTNVVWSASTTPAIGATPYLIIEQITAGSTYPLTNYQVWVNQR